ncbi:MAG: hypothetical protein ACOC80_11450 [Petrotogales bacterium]
MGIGNSFENIDSNIAKQREDYKIKQRNHFLENPFSVYQDSIGDERFASLKDVKKYLEKAIPSEFSVSCHNGKEMDDEAYDETSYEIEVTIKLKRKSDVIR